MSMKLYVGNIPHSMTEDELKQVFTTAGTVISAKIIIDRDTGRSRGFGFVEMSSKEEGLKAVEMFHGKDVNGRPLTVNEARPQEPRSNDRRSGGGGGGGGGGDRYPRQAQAPRRSW